MYGPHRAGPAVQNQADIFGWTPLHLAAFLGLEEFVSGLVEAGSDALLKDCVGHMPIDLAGSEGHTKIVGFLAPITFVSEKKTAKKRS